ncbi:MAG: hypothetical protein CMJ83_00285 [Planctomycetes bacterium]|nr:hypothetical protein [Planctomycetota bacterium]
MNLLSGSEGSNPSLSVAQCGGRPRSGTSAVLVCGLLALAGCSSRSLTIESTPPGAKVILDRKLVGTTPVTVSYRYGGIREILLIPKPAGLEGVPYKPAIVLHDTWTFALDAPIVDGFADLFGTEDHQIVRVTLEPNDVPGLYTDERTRAGLLAGLRERADQLRTRIRELFIEAPPVDAPHPVAPDRK